jgi:hypothetical protein
MQDGNAPFVGEQLNSVIGLQRAFTKTHGIGHFYLATTIGHRCLPEGA